MGTETMNLQAEKLEIVRMLLNTNDEGLIREVKALFKSRGSDWWDEMDGQQKETILEGIAQADRGRSKNVWQVGFKVVWTNQALDTFKKRHWWQW
jgi:hypothetical protein